MIHASPPVCLAASRQATRAYVQVVLDSSSLYAEGTGCGRTENGVVNQPHLGMNQVVNGVMVTWARKVAELELAAPLPRRWAHTQGVAQRAADLARILGADADLLAAAAVLHDVGYAPRLAVTGFHPLDGARFLRDVHSADERLVRLVANHSFALLEAEERGLREVLEAEFPLLEDQRLVDALVWCDMTTTPDGDRTTVEARVAEIVSRYGAHSVVGRFIRRASPEIFTAVERVEAALAGQPR
jgi:putative nucleotidyltransferase with HDIG domain